jgi:hypothetical protein
MEKLMQVKNYLLELAFVALLARILSVGCGIGEALAVISLVSSMTYSKWLTKSKMDQYEELKNKINSDNEALKSQINAEFAKLMESHKDLTARVSSLAMDKSIRRMNESQVQTTPIYGVSADGTVTPTATKRYF